MKKYIVIAAMFLTRILFATDVAPQKTGLVVTIDQQSLGGFEKLYQEHGINAVKSMLSNAKNLGYFGEALTGLISTLERNDKYTLIEAWDIARRDWIKKYAGDKYTNIYFALGELARDDDYMAYTWKQAQDENDTLDYISMVHGPFQLIKPQWGVAKNKIRIAYSEACQGGSGINNFVKEYGALVSAGHNEHTKYQFSSASPFFSFPIMQALFNGYSLPTSSMIGWIEGSTSLQDAVGFVIAKQMANFNSKEQALEGSKIYLAWDNANDADNITINTDVRQMARSGAASEAPIQ